MKTTNNGPLVSANKGELRLQRNSLAHRMGDRRGKGRAKIIPASSAILLPYQARWAADNSRLKIAEKARQIGWSWTAAYTLVRRSCQPGRQIHAWVSSRDELQARLFLQDSETFAHRLITRRRGRITRTANTLTLPNGTSIHCLSSNADAQAGKRGHRILDEFALHPDPRRLYSITYPGITWGGALEIISTHRGLDNYFHRLITEIKHEGNPKGFSLHSVTLQQALEQGLLYKLQQNLPPDDPRQAMDEADYFDFIHSGCPDEESFRQEYCCDPAQELAAFLPYSVIQGCLYHPSAAWEYTVAPKNQIVPAPPRCLSVPPGFEHLGRRPADADPAKAEIYIGVDIGRQHDLTVIWILDRCGATFHTRAVLCLDRHTFEEQEATLYPWLWCSRVVRCCIDQSGLGTQFVERALRRFGVYRVGGISFTPQKKEEMAYRLRAVMEDHQLLMPNDREIITDLRAVRKDVTAGGHIRFAADRTPTGHADRFWALALALEAAKERITSRAITR